MEIQWETLAQIPVSNPQQAETISSRSGPEWLPLFRITVPLLPGMVGIARSLEGAWRPVAEGVLRLHRPRAVLSVEYQGDTIILTIDERGTGETTSLVGFAALPALPIGWVIAALLAPLVLALSALLASQAFFAVQQARVVQEAATGIEKLVENPWFPIAIFVIAVIALTR